MTSALRLALFTLSAVGMTAMVTSLFLQVLAREFNWRVDWTEEIGRFAFISMVFMAAAYSTLNRSHLRVSVFSDLVARKIGARPVQTFHTLVLLGFAAVMVYFSAINFVEGLQFPNVSPALRFNQNILFIAMCGGFTLIFLLHLRDLWALMRGGTLDEGGPVNE
ncbi:TRAP transporter small permease [Roseobacter weihaiensis]|uniref:TRAP transporter small permease n=1 Tax=Roseobacter weihaiensis TaxID=2763262 RepID=UPI001D0AA89D|nr:TRAP transporter small permease subunit [Roseobacter sp. H9]